MASPVEFFENLGGNIVWLLLVVAGVMFYIGFQIFDVESSKTFGYIFAFAPVYLPIVTFYIFYEQWLYYVRKDFDLKQGRTTLEIKIPEDIFKSPEAMELVLMQMYQTAGPDNHVQTYWDGKNPPMYALEIVSRGGDVRFYINTPKKKFKNLIESQLYAQYPGIEVVELDIDYTAEIPWDPTRFGYFSFHFGLKKADGLPIKTYLEYGLDKMPKEEEKVDPITSLIETLGSVGSGEYMWVQVLIQANREQNFKTGSLVTHPDWKKKAAGEIDNIIKTANERMKKVSKELNKESEYDKPNTMVLTDAEKETIKSIERSIGKNAFDTVIRGMYIGKTESYLPGERLGALATAWRSFDDLTRNFIAVRWRTDFDWPWWQDRKGRRSTHYKKKELDEYKRRDYTHHNKADTPKVMTTEELATIYHLPGRVALTPSLARIPSKRVEAPSNLPIG